MGTRGAYGFRINNKDKITYNHWDSYPDALGFEIMNFIKNTPIVEMKDIARKIILIDSDSIPTKEQISNNMEWVDTSVGNQTEEDWYCLLHRSQGDISAYKKSLVHMLDEHEFLGDSLFCEWAYIINLDNNMLEIYRGFNKKSVNAKGRYKDFTVDDKKIYYGVSLIEEIPLNKIQTTLETSVLQEMCKELAEAS